MSIHSSLRGGRSGKSGTQRNVMKRHERVRHLITKGLWNNPNSAFGLPKIKTEKLKARKSASKEKEAAGEAAAPAEGAAAKPAASKPGAK